MANGLEKKQAQPECRKFLNMIGWCYKADVEMVCEHCHKVNYPTHKGMFDYIAGVRRWDTDYFDIAAIIGVEVKATPDERFLFSNWGNKQRAWAKAWNNRISPHVSSSFIWLQYRDERANSKNRSTRRRVWFIPQHTMLWAEQQLLETGMKSLPVDAAARTKGRDNMTLELTAEALFRDFEMEWRSGFGWFPQTNTFIWQALNVDTPPEISELIEFSRQYPHPDLVVKGMGDK